MKTKIICILVMTLLIITALPVISADIEEKSGKYEEIDSSELLLDGQPDLIYYEHGERKGDDDYYGQICQYPWGILSPWFIICFLRLELQNDGPGEMDCTIEIVLRYGNPRGGVFYPSEDRYVDFIRIDDAPEFVNIHNPGDSVFLIFICLLLPPSDFEVSVYAETTYSLHDNVVIRNSPIR